MQRNRSLSQAVVDDLVSELPALVPATSAAEFLHVSTRTLRTYVRTGRIRALRTSPSGSGRVLIARSELAKFLAECEEPSPFRS